VIGGEPHDTRSVHGSLVEVRVEELDQVGEAAIVAEASRGNRFGERCSVEVNAEEMSRHSGGALNHDFAAYEWRELGPLVDELRLHVSSPRLKSATDNDQRCSPTALVAKSPNCAKLCTGGGGRHQRGGYCVEDIDPAHRALGARMWLRSRPWRISRSLSCGARALSRCATN